MKKRKLRQALSEAIEIARRHMHARREPGWEGKQKWIATMGDDPTRLAQLEKLVTKLAR